MTSRHSSLSKTTHYRRDLQGLRAIAVALVVLAHSGVTVFAGGFVGVDVFFVLSGYLITGLLVHELEHTGSLSFVGFYSRRFKRLLPALVLMLCVSGVVAVSVFSREELEKQLASAPFAAIWVSNIYFTFVSFDYFDALSGKDLFLHTWSLGVEEQFYLVWPLIICLSHLGFRKRGDTAGRRNLFLILVAMFLFGTVLCVYLTYTHPQAAFYLMPSRIWQFSLGSMVKLAFRVGCNPGWLPSANSVSRSVAYRASLFLGLVLILGGAVIFDSQAAYPGYRALIPSIGASLILVASHCQPANSCNPLANRFLVFIGDRSYSIYLWHWPVLTIGFSYGYKGDIAPTLLLVIATLLLSMFSYRFVELPIWKGGLSLIAPRKAILASLFVVVLTTFVMYHGTRQVFYVHARQNVSTDISRKWRNDLPIIYNMNCDASARHAKVVPCVFGDKGAPRTAVLLGDSIGAQWFSFVHEVFSAPDWRLVVMTKSSCPLVDEKVYFERSGKEFTVCSEWRNSVLEEIDRLQPDVLFMGSSPYYSFSGSQWERGSERILSRLSRSANTVFLIMATPALEFDGPSCILRHYKTGEVLASDKCTSRYRDDRLKSVAGFLQQAADRFDNVDTLNFNDLVCRDHVCSAMTAEGTVVFRDNMHLTDSYVRTLIPELRERTRQVYRNSHNKSRRVASDLDPLLADQ